MANISDGFLTFASVCKIISMTIGIPGNILTIAALAKYKRVQNATTIFVINLSVSDLLFNCLGTTSYLSIWGQSMARDRIFCQFYSGARNALCITMIFTVFAVTINRYVIVVHPKLYQKVFQKRNLVIMLMITWIAPLMIYMPTFCGVWGRFDLDTTTGACTLAPDHKNKSPKQFILISVFIIPSVFIAFFYLRLFFVVRKTSKKFQKSFKISTASHLTTIKSSLTISAINSDHNVDIKKNTMRPNLKMGQPTLSSIETDGISASTTSGTEMDTIKTSKAPSICRSKLKRSIAHLKNSVPTRKDKRLGIILFAIMLCFITCHIPLLVLKVWYSLSPHPVINIIANIMLNFTTCINPVIYVVIPNEYRKAYKHLFKWCCRSKTPM